MNLEDLVDEALARTSGRTGRRRRRRATRPERRRRAPSGSSPSLRAALSVLPQGTKAVAPHHPAPTTLLRGVELFAGAGGFTLGVLQAGCNVRLAMQRDPVAVKTSLRAGHLIVQQDVADLAAYADQLHGVDLLVAGPPCQPFSSMGGGKAEYDARDGFPLVLDAIDQLHPQRVVIENVRGLMETRYTAYRKKLLIDLAKRFAHVGVWDLNASDFGVPQDRRRVFIWGAERPLLPPAATHGPGRDQPYFTVREALPGLRAGAIHVRSKTAKSRSLDKPSPTVLTRGTLYTARRPGLVYGRDPVSSKDRRLSPSELQVIQGFPADYPFSGGITARHRQVGNAVPPPLGRAVTEAATAGMDTRLLDADEVRTVLAGENPMAKLFDGVWDGALVGVSNLSKTTPGKLVGVYDLEILQQIAVDHLLDTTDLTRAEAQAGAAAYVERTLTRKFGRRKHDPVVRWDADPRRWKTPRRR